MPEVIEVCLTALFLNHKLKNKTLSNIQILGGRYSRHKLQGLEYFQDNKPFKIDRVNSKGKFLWFELSKENKTCYLLNTFGLEGQWGFEKQKHSGVMLEIKSSLKEKLYNLYFTDSRNFGTIAITDNHKVLEKKLHKLAPDFLKTSFTNQDFHDRIKKIILGKNCKVSKVKGNKEIVKILMDQTLKNGLGSGLGNYLVSSVLYEAKMSPYKKLSDIYRDKELSNRLAEAIRYIVKLAYMTEEIGYMEHIDPKIEKFVKKLREDIKKNKNHEYNFNPDIEIKDNQKFEFTVYRKAEDPKGHKVSADTIIKGRTTYWSPSVQK